MPENKRKSQGTTHFREKPLLLGFVVQKEYPDRKIEFSIRWERLLGVFLILAVIGWFSMTSALYTYLKYQQDFKEITFTNTLLLQRSELRRKMGDHHIQESMVQIEAGNYGDAFRLLHFGVARSPGNLEGRKLIAEFYELGRKRPAIAAEYLIGGLEYNGLEEIEYVKQLLRVLLRNQMDEKIQEIADTYLPEEPVLNDINRMLALGAASAHYQRGNYDRAEDYLINYKLIESIDGLLIYSKIIWDRGNRIAAINKLEQMINRFPDSDPLLSQLSSYHREIGNMDKARRFAILRSIKNPLNYSPKIELLYIYDLEGDVGSEESEIKRMFEQFSEDQIALVEFANFAAKTGKVKLAERIRSIALENEFDDGIFTILLLEAKIVRKDYQSVSELSESLIEKKAPWLTDQWAVFSGLRAIAAFAMGRPDLGDVYLQNFLKDTSQQPQAYLNVANHFSNIDRLPQASKILAIAHQQFPKNQKILSELIKAELELGNTEKLYERLNQLLKMRRPPMEILARAYQKIGSDRFIFAENRDSLLLQLGAILRNNNQGQSRLEAEF